MVESKNTLLVRFVEEEVSEPVAPEVAAMVQAIRQQRSDGVAAVLFYGSCLRDQIYTDGLLDFYVIVDDFGGFYRHLLPRVVNWMVPPNVYYLETDFAGQRLCAKYAVLNRTQFAQQTSDKARHVSLWARLSQPCRCAFVTDAAMKTFVVERVAAAIQTFYGAAKPLMSFRFTSDQLWQTGLAHCYRTEFRAEKSGRGGDLQMADQQRYRRLTNILVQNDPNAEEVAAGQYSLRQAQRSGWAPQWQWFKWRVSGRVLQVLRLAKAAFTFTDGLSYVLYKIEKHSGQKVPTSAWQKRHPLLAAPGLAWKLYRKGGFR